MEENEASARATRGGNEPPLSRCRARSAASAASAVAAAADSFWNSSAAAAGDGRRANKASLLLLLLLLPARDTKSVSSACGLGDGKCLSRR